MKSTDRFKATIHDYLLGMAESDPLFQEKFLNPKKKIEDCITYILNTVHKSGCNGFTDDEIFGMALHYYDEENINVGKPMDNMEVIVNHQVQLSPEEIEEAKEKAVRKIISDEQSRLRAKPLIPKTVNPSIQQGFLF